MAGAAAAGVLVLMPGSAVSTHVEDDPTNPDQIVATELPPAQEEFSCRGSSVRLATSDDFNNPETTKVEPFVANRDETPCVDADTGAPPLTQVPSDAAPEGDPRAVVGGAFARTRDADDDQEEPPPARSPEDEGVLASSEAGAAFAMLTDGEGASLEVMGARAKATVRCVDGQPHFEGESSVILLSGQSGGEPVGDPLELFAEHNHPGDDPNGPIHFNHQEIRQEGDRTIFIQRAVWLERGDPPDARNGQDGEVVLGEAIVDVTGNPCSGRLTIVKNRIPDGAGEFTFTGAGPEMRLEDDGVEGGTPRADHRDLGPGTFTIAETDPNPADDPNRFRTESSCVGDGQPEGGSTSEGLSHTVELARDEDITCTFINIDTREVCPGPNQVLNDQGECVVTVVVCPDGTELPANEQCPGQVECPAGTLDQATNQCVVNEITCPVGTPSGQQCVVNETVCPAGSIRDGGRCVVTETDCPAGSVENATGQCVSTQVVAEDLPRGGVLTPLADVPGARDSLCSRPGFGRNIAIVGTNRGDRITGTNRSDRIFAFGGRDRVSGGRGNDCVEGGSGNDNLDGSNGADALIGGIGRDILNGGTGRDRLEGEAGHDKLTGGSGHDRMIGGAGRDKLSGGLGNDRLEGGAARDYIDGGAGRDRISGGSGNDAINVATAGGGRDTVRCGSGRDTVRANGEDRVAGDCERVLVVRLGR